MADYGRNAFVQRNLDAIGTATGDIPGTTEFAVCVCGLRPPDEDGHDWTALTPECAGKLYEMLGAYRHTWERTEVESTADAMTARVLAAESELARLRAREAGRATPPTLAEVKRLTARCGHRQALTASVWLVACRNDGRVLLLRTHGREITVDAPDVLSLPEAVERFGITRWWPLDGATMQVTDWPDAPT